MPLTFSVHHNEGYFSVKYIGLVTDDEIVSAFTVFFEHGEWIPGLNVLVDLEKVNGQQVTQEGLRRLASLVGSVYSAYGVAPQVATYAPNDLSFGLARMYSVFVNNIEEHNVFREYDRALQLVEQKSVTNN